MRRTNHHQTLLRTIVVMFFIFRITIVLKVNTQHRGHMGQIFKTEKNNLVRATEACGKLLSEKYAYKSDKTALLLSNVIDADHQNSCLFTNKGHFSSPSWVFIGVLAKFH